MTQYAVLMFAPGPADPANATAEEQAAHDRHFTELTSDEHTSLVTAFGLEASTTATAICGDTLTDGPFLDAKEVIAGFYVIEAPDLDAALAMARRNPILQQGGGVEVRPVLGGFVRS